MSEDRIVRVDTVTTNMADKPAKRVRRKIMDVSTFSRFQNTCASALQKVILEFDPSPLEMQMALKSLHTQLESLMHMAKRRN